MKRRCGLALFLALLWPTASAQFSINFSFGAGVSTAQQDASNAAAGTWQGIIQGYQPGVSLPGGVDITVEADAGSPFTGPTKVLLQGGYVVADEGRIAFDPAELAALDALSLEIFLTQELAKTLGFGTLWAANGVYVAGSGQYTGAAGLAAYQNEFDAGATFVPVELYAGESDVHWDEIDLAAGLTGITNSSGQDFSNELMTAWIGPDAGDTFISETTIRSLEDLGYQVIVPSPVPEPSSALLALLGLPLLLKRVRKH